MLIKAFSLFGMLDDKRTFSEKTEKVEKVMHDKTHEILQRSIHPKLSKYIRYLKST